MPPNFMYIVKVLNGRKEGKDWRCDCPVPGHGNGKHLILTDKRGTIEGHCMMGGNWRAALEERGLWDSPRLGTATVARPLAVRQASPQPPTLKPVWVEDYIYRNTDGETVAIKGRFTLGDKKTFLWKVNGATDWGGLKGLGPELPLYGAELLGAQADVWFVEGEKAANACRDHGLTALCGYAGASVLPEKALLALEGRVVYIWPDNDAQGRAYAIKVKTYLASLGVLALIIQPQGEEKADAYDYFQNGGTIEGLATAPQGPTITAVTRGWEIVFPDGVHILFEDAHHGRLALDVEATIWTEAPGVSNERYSERLNLLSGSGRTSLRRSLDEVQDRPKGYWTDVLNKAIAMIRTAIKEDDPSMSVSDAPDIADDGYIAFPLLLANGPTIWFGDGGTGKSFLALALAKAVCEGGEFLKIGCGWRGVIYLDYETDAATVKRRLRKMGGEPDGMFYWPGLGRPLTEMIPALQHKIAKDMIGLVVIDSAVPACGGEPEKADTARAFFAAISQLGVAVLIISHITKAGEDQYPFGSVMWNNLARCTWNIKAEQDGDSILHIGFYNRKINDDRKHQPIGIRLTFDATGVEMVREQIAAESLVKGLSVPNQMRRIMQRGKASLKEMAAETGKPVDAIRLAANRMKDAVRLDMAPDGSFYWGLKG